jgi:uncharacterized Tic20 family protein
MPTFKLFLIVAAVIAIEMMLGTAMLWQTRQAMREYIDLQKCEYHNMKSELSLQIDQEILGEP